MVKDEVLIMLTPGFPENESDTSCLPAVQQFVLALKEFHPASQIMVITFQYPFLKGEMLWHDIRVIALGGKNRKGFYKITTWLRAIGTLQKISRHFKIKGILSFWLTECAFIGKIFADINNIPHFMWIHGQDAKAGNKYVKFIRPKGKEIIAISDFTRQEFFKNHRILPLITAENGVLETAHPPLNIGHRNYDIIGVGSFIKLKRYDLFIEIVAGLKEIFPLLKVVLIGSGPEEKALKELCEQYKLGDTVKFTGPLKHEDVISFMNNSRVLLHTPVYEGHSTVMLEALYSGCHVVSTQQLSEHPIKNLWYGKSKDELLGFVLKLLDKPIIPERICYNSMRTTSQKIYQLFTNC